MLINAKWEWVQSSVTAISHQESKVNRRFCPCRPLNDKKWETLKGSASHMCDLWKSWSTFSHVAPGSVNISYQLHQYHNNYLKCLMHSCVIIPHTQVYRVWVLVRLWRIHTPTGEYLLDLPLLLVLLPLALCFAGRGINMMGHSAGCQGNAEKAQLGGRIWGNLTLGLLGKYWS